MPNGTKLTLATRLAALTGSLAPSVQRQNVIMPAPLPAKLITTQYKLTIFAKTNEFGFVD